MGTSRPVAVVAGALANKPGNGGEGWVRPTWVMGLERLGFDAWLVEEVAPVGGTAPADAVAWFREVAEWFGLSGRVVLVCGEDTVVGPPLDEVRELMEAAHLFVNISGHLRRLDLPTPGATRVFVDLDPGFTQVWAEQGRIDLSGHDRYVTVGTAFGSSVCPFPDRGIEWVPTLPPVLLHRWPSSPMPDEPLVLCTVGSWRPPHGPVSWAGTDYGVKAHEFRRFLDLPSLVDTVSFELALVIHDGDAQDRRRLVDAGFVLRDPAVVAGSPAAFASYVAGSSGEWSVAQDAYSRGRTGWVSDRSAHYLASGRPVVVQDTRSFLPAGEGLLVFDDPRGAADAVRRVERDPQGHAAAARSLAERHLDSDLVLGTLCDRLGIAA